MFVDVDASKHCYKSLLCFHLLNCFYDGPTNDRFHSLNAEIGQEDGEEDGEEVGDVLEWSQDLSHISGLQYALNHSERHL